MSKEVVIVTEERAGSPAWKQAESCRKFAAQKGWTVTAEVFRTDLPSTEGALLCWEVSSLGETREEVLLVLLDRDVTVAGQGFTTGRIGGVKAAFLDALRGLPVRRPSGKKLGAPTTLDRTPEVVERIVSLHNAGQSLRQIAILLNEEGVRGLRGGGWYPKTIRGVLAQARAAGKEVRDSGRASA